MFQTFFSGTQNLGEYSLMFSTVVLVLEMMAVLLASIICALQSKVPSRKANSSIASIALSRSFLCNVFLFPCWA
uniref:Uncharacterized protein n=1 Tax=Anguilla anguilla TaxID=7936 RepID=A0A0E9XBP5_ANGAN